MHKNGYKEETFIIEFCFVSCKKSEWFGFDRNQVAVPKNRKRPCWFVFSEEYLSHDKCGIEPINNIHYPNRIIHFILDLAVQPTFQYLYWREREKTICLRWYIMKLLHLQYDVILWRYIMWLPIKFMHVSDVRRTEYFTHYKFRTVIFPPTNGQQLKISF